mgnify:FL=1
MAGVKKILQNSCLIFAVCLICCTIKVQAKYFKTPYLLEMAKSDAAPYVTSYIVGAKASDSMVFNGTIGNTISLKQSDLAVSFKESKEGLHTIILVDNSGSVDKEQFSEAKKQIAALRKSMKAQDKMTLYTVGTLRASGQKSNVLRNGNQAVSGNETKTLKSDIKKINKIPYHKEAKSRTVLYRSLNEVLTAYADAQPSQRTVVLLVTDGEDDSLGKDNSKESTLENVKKSMVPVYGILLKNKAKKPNKKKMNATYQILEEKNSRGYNFDKCHWNTSKKQVKEGFKTFSDIVWNQTYVVKLEAPNNKKLDGISTITLSEKRGNGNMSGRIDYSRSTPDKEAPVIGNIKKSKSNAITFELTDNSGSVVGADKVSNYVVKSKSKDDNGRVWAINNVNYNSVDNTVVLTFKEDLYTGEYTLICSNIHDDTQEANPINQEYNFKFTGLDEKSEQTKQFVRSYWWIALIALVLIIGVIVIIITKRKPGKVVEINPDDLLKADSKLIRLTITDRAGKIQDVEWNVEGSLFIGRSDICNIYFDDERLSKQHFVIEVTKMACYIEDLESTNGTFVNGVKMTNRRMLLDGDIITAGREKFVFHTMKAEAISEAEEE